MPLEALRHEVTPVGLHYLLVHYDIPIVDPATWRLTLGEMELTLAEIEARPAVTRPVTMECAGNGRAALTPRPVSQPWLLEAVGNAEWTGTPLAPLLQEAGLLDDAVDVVFTGLDAGVEAGLPQRYERALSVADALGPDVLLAYAMNGLDLPPQHGFPLRLLVPGWYGMTSVKWLTRITASSHAFDGPQMRAYRFREAVGDEGVPLTRMEPRALLVPPGYPDFMSRTRVLRPGLTLLEGRAWSGWPPVTAVDVSLDGGGTWSAADLVPSSHPRGWLRWTWLWP